MFYEFQKLITSIVLVVLLVIGIAKLSNSVFETEKNVVAYKVEIQEKVSETEEVQELDESSSLSPSSNTLGFGSSGVSCSATCS